MPLTTIVDALESEALRARFMAAALKSAGYVLTEDPATENHEMRVRWARRCLAADGATYLAATGERMRRYALATNGTIQGVGVAATDGDLEYLVAVILGDALTLAHVTETSAESAL